ncbi:MAG: YeeE/YedE family protein [Rhodospirillaceae bacterium]|nr:YeeE/YedE family protein [Rhodospirillaceae bacterium]
MNELPTSFVMTAFGFAGGAVLGATARWVGFCTFGAIEDALVIRDNRRLRAWLLAVAVAILALQLARHFGVTRIEETLYLGAQFGWLGAISGGIAFGFGMAMVGTCSYGTLVRAAGGDLRAAINALVMGLVAYMTARGLTGLFRVSVIEPTNIDLTTIGGQGLAHVAASVFSIALPDAWLFVSVFAVGGLTFWCFRNPEFRREHKLIFAGLTVGLVIAFGFISTALFGNDPFDPQRVVSFSFALPPGEAIVYLLTLSGAEPNFGIGAVFGTVAGAFVVAARKKQLRLEAFDDAREMRRHLAGATLMGFGGVLALGCTVGQGMSAMAVLSLSAPLAMLGIVLGAWVGLNMLIEGTLLGGLRARLFNDRS